jgi:hypothetical protein
MANQQTKLGDLDNARYPNVKPTNVEGYLASHPKESLSQWQW